MTPSKTLILLAHGSRAQETPGEMAALAETLGRMRPDLRIQGAFLSLTPPDLAAALADAAAQGAREAHILPLFLFSGKHILEDIPAQVETLRKAYPDLRIVLLEPIGRDAGFGAFLLNASGL
jgi:sirohydrochlorin cobaltochelatase